MYAAQPAPFVLAFESTRRPLIPKSHNFTFPLSSSNMFDGLISKKKQFMIKISKFKNFL